MRTQTLSSFEAYIDANRHASLRGMILGRERDDWALTHLSVNNKPISIDSGGLVAPNFLR